MALSKQVAVLRSRDLLTDAIIAIYLFGSGRTSTSPRDVDLLVVWDESRVSPLEASEFRPVLAEGLAINGAPVDIVLLSTSEVISSRFVELEGAELIYSADWIR